MRITLNGRFLVAPQTGVQRVASNLIRALDRRLAAGEDCRWELCAPAAASAPDLAHIAFRAEGGLSGVAWEQIELPRRAEAGRLVNLCNAGPVMFPSALTLVHDAQVYLTPQSYSRAFVAWYRFALPRLAARSRRVATVSAFSKAMLVQHGVAPADKIVVIPNGADHILQAKADCSALRRHGLEPGRFVFVFGALQRHKNLDFLLDVFAHPRLAGVTLVICGGLTRAEIEAAFGRKPAANVVLAGRLGDDQVRGLLEAAACLAMPSSTEGFGLPAAEAMTLGCPVVLAPTGALPEVGGEAASYAAVGDVEAWVDAIVELIEDRSGRPARRQACRARGGRFTWERAGEALAGTLAQVLA